MSWEGWLLCHDAPAKQAADYDCWNAAIVAKFFRPELAGRSVHLYVNEETVAELGRRLPGAPGIDGFVAAVSKGPAWVPQAGLCQMALRTLEEWRGHGRPQPPYVAYLALFVLAAGLEGDFAPHAYYPRLHTLLGEDPDEGMLPSFDRMYELWIDLEQWSQLDKRGELGVFEVQWVGDYVHVDIPRAQAILSETERAMLPSIFANAGLDPGFPPGEEDLGGLVRRYGHDDLAARTLRVLSDVATDLGCYLASVLLTELEAWDGTVPGRQHGAGAQHVPVKLCLLVDRVAGRASATLRGSVRADVPTGGFWITHAGAIGDLVALEGTPGWTTQLSTPQGEAIDAMRLDWEATSVWTTRDSNARFSFIGRSVRIFVTGAPFGLPGLLEANRIPTGAGFYVAFSRTAASALTPWLESECDAAQEIQLESGLPTGWQLWSVRRALDDQTVCGRYPILRVLRRCKIQLRHGLRLGGNTYFNCAPPVVGLDGGTGEELLWVSEGRLIRLSDRTFQLEPARQADSSIRVEARLEDGGVVDRLTLHIAAESHRWRQVRCGTRCGPHGEVDRRSDGLVVAGVSFPRGRPPTSEFSIGALHLPEWREAGGIRTIAIGRSFGEALAVRGEEWVAAWLPVWLIAMRRRGSALFCADGLEGALPSPVAHGGKRDQRLWRDTLWAGRKRIRPPEHRDLRLLWNRYIEMARDVQPR